MNNLPEKRRPEPLRLNALTTEQINALTESGSYFVNEMVEYQELMMMYSCAIREVRTKLEVLNADLSMRYKRNPIEFISYRIKKPVSLVQKMRSRGLPLSVSAIEGNIFDVAGIRVICSFIDDIYAVASMLTNQDDIILLETKDYIKSPKKNGYRSLHLILEIPVFFSDQTRHMKVEVQIRTIAMDFWASLEHQLKYKKDVDNEDAIVAELAECAETIAATDQRMLQIRQRIEENSTAPTPEEELLEKLGHINIPVI